MESSHPEDWQRCESMHHEGDNLDSTVEWRDIGLMCDECSSALVDIRAITLVDLKQIIESLHRWERSNPDYVDNDVVSWIEREFMRKEAQDA